jgi:hypothetical protein
MRKGLPLALLTLWAAGPLGAAGPEPPLVVLPMPPGATALPVDLVAEFRRDDGDSPGEARLLARVPVEGVVGEEIRIALPPEVAALPAGARFRVLLPGLPVNGNPHGGAFLLESTELGLRVLPAPDILQVEDAIAYPNPFNPLVEDVTLSFSLTELAEITVRIFDWSGNAVGTVFRGSGQTGANQVRWSGQAEDGRRLANGVYLVRIEAASGTRREPVVLRVALWND